MQQRKQLGFALWHLVVLVAVGAILFSSAPASANLLVDKVVIDFAAGAAPRSDVEVQNAGAETLYVEVTPSEVLAPGLPGEQRVQGRDPEERGLLVTPNRLVLEPGQRQLIRFALLSRPNEKDRVYRVTVTPVVGGISSSETALKVLVGYDILVIAQPPSAHAELQTDRNGQTLTITNMGNTNALLFNGQQCDPSGGNCVDLPSRRIYSGASWQIGLPYGTPATFNVTAAGKTTVQRF